MPELPEVEVLRRSLLAEIVEEGIVEVGINELRLREPIDRTTLEASVGATVTDIRRRAKYLLIDLDDGTTLIIHLGMSGRLTVVRRDQATDSHEHVWWRLSSGRRMRFVDPRRFGLVIVRPSPGLEKERHFAHLGPEPLEGEPKGPYLAARARGRKIKVKDFIMNGGVLVGVGNIYASEALWRCRVHPRRAAGRISPHRWQSIAAAIVEVLTDAIGEGGTTLNDFTDGRGDAGYFQVSLAVYGREGETCRRCERPIRRVVDGGRSTFYCPRCQH